ncbi:BET1 homolog [Brevipalpus obovatus]|uniref:BET1 homolog n=1 Tax=Brevipalpus obovatus TaxID=246614 RepID=UPI003D9E8C18
MSRRNNASYSSTSYEEAEFIEPENESLITGLKGKVTQLKSLTIDMGDEIRYQNAFLKEMDTEMDSTWGRLSSSMKRVTRLASLPGNKLIFFLLGFAFLIFFLIYVMIRFK